VDKAHSQNVKLQSARYIMIKGILYKRGYTQAFLKCLLRYEAEYVLREMHEGVCENHSGGRMLAHKAMRVSYYWPTMRKDRSNWSSIVTNVKGLPES
jgi:hypothetical protein